MGTMRIPIIASRSALVRRVISSATDFTPSPPVPASWLRRAWTITSSPIRSIISSSRSAGTRRVAASRAVAVAARRGSEADGATGLGGTGVSIASGATATGAARGTKAGAGRGGLDGRVRNHVARVTRHRRAAGFDGQTHIVRDEDEDLVEGGLRRLRRHQGRPREIKLLRIELAQGRQRGRVDSQRAGAEAAQLVEQKDRVGAVRHHVFGERHGQAPDRRLGVRSVRVGDHRGRRILRLGLRFVARDDGEARDDGVPGGRIGAIRGLHEAPDVVLRFQGDLDERRGGLRLALPDPVERRLEVVDEAGHAVEAEHGARALQRVQGPEGGVDKSLVLGRAVEVEQRELELFHEFRRFLAEDFDGIDVVHQPSNFLATAVNCSGLNGLVIHPVAPAAFAACLIVSSDSVVRKTIGTPL